MKKILLQTLIVVLPLIGFSQQSKTTPSQKQYEQLRQDLKNMQQQMQDEMKLLQDSVAALQRQLNGHQILISPDGQPFTYHYFFPPSDQADGHDFFWPGNDDSDGWKDYGGI